MEPSSNKSDSKSQKGPSLSVAAIRAPAYLWTALEAIVRAETTRNASLLIVSGGYSGRIGVFCNRYISGAVVDGSGLSEMEAVVALLAPDSGIFAFRACLPGEAAELRHGLALDIEELLRRRSEQDDPTLTPADIIASTFSVPESQLQTLPPSARAVPEAEKQRTKPAPVTPAVAQTTGKPRAHSFPDWYSGLAQTEIAGSTLGQLLNPGALASPASEQAGTNKLDAYLQMIEEQLQKVNLKLGTVQPPHGAASHSAAGGAPDIDARDPLQLFHELLNREQERALSLRSAQLDAAANKKRSPGQPNGSRLKSEDLLTPAQMHANLIRLPKGLSESAALPVWKKVEMVAPVLWSDRRIVTGTFLAIVACLVWLGCYTYTVSECHTQMSKGIRLLNENDPLAALPCFVYAADLAPDYARAYFYLGIALAEVGDYDQALDALGKTMQLGEPKSKVLVVRACVLGKMHLDEKAIEDCTNALFDLPSNTPSLAVRSACRFRSEHFNQANKDMIDVFDNTKSWEMRARLYRERGAAQLRLHHWQEAIDDLSKVVDTFPNERIYIMLGDAYRAEGKFNEAIVAYSQALKVNAGSYPALLRRGLTALALNQGDEALEDFNQAIAHNAQGTEALLQRGSIRLASKQFAPAAEDLQRVVDLTPYNQDAQDKLAQANQHLPKPAGTTAQGVAKLPPAASAATLPDPKALFILGNKHLHDGDTDDAVLCFAKLVRSQPSNPSARKYLAYALYQQGDARNAVIQLEALNVLQPLELKDFLLMANCLADSGQVDAARSKLRKLLEMNPNCVEAQTALTRISADMIK